MYKQFNLLLGTFLCSCAAAQTLAPKIVTALGPIAPITTMAGTAPARLLAESSLRLESPGKSAAHFSFLPAGGVYNPDQKLEALEDLSQVREVKTLFSTRSSLPLVHFWGGRLRFDGFTSTLNMQNVQLGPSAAGALLDFRPRRQDYPGEPRSIDLYGVSFSLHLGRNTQIERPAQIWHSLARMASSIR